MLLSFQRRRTTECSGPLRRVRRLRPERQKRTGSQWTLPRNVKPPTRDGTNRRRPGTPECAALTDGVVPRRLHPTDKERRGRVEMVWEWFRRERKAYGKQQRGPAKSSSRTCRMA